MTAHTSRNCMTSSAQMNGRANTYRPTMLARLTPTAPSMSAPTTPRRMPAMRASPRRTRVITRSDRKDDGSRDQGRVVDACLLAEPEPGRRPRERVQVAAGAQDLGRLVVPRLEDHEVRPRRDLVSLRPRPDLGDRVAPRARREDEWRRDRGAGELRDLR